MIRWLVVVVAACGGATAKPATLDQLGWLAGQWHSPLLDAHWQNVAGVLYGIALDDHGFEVNVIDDMDDDGKPAPITLTALENAKDPMRFALVSATPDELRFVDAQHRVVRVARTADGWRGEFSDEPGGQPVVFEVHPAPPAASPVLEEADRAFAADTAADGADGWARHFADDGAMWRGRRIEGPAIRDAIGHTLAHGVLRWQPVASGERGELGFTLGTFTLGASRGSYATIWRRGPDGTWKVVFDLGRPAAPRR